MYTGIVIKYMQDDIHFVNDNDHISIRIYKTLYHFVKQLEMQNTNLEMLKSDIKNRSTEINGSVLYDEETFEILDDLFSRVNLLKHYTDELIG